ncbi:MAG TPA: cysteine desulfurase [Ruminococcaceae bacterium]|nr:cysteine desulfurase [Oscillospiraceae bacterium]
MPITYLDNSATTRVCKEAATAALQAMTEVYGNPSSLHGMGIAAEELMEQSRKKVADALGCEARELVFTSGGTEANNLAVFGAVHAKHRKGNRIVTTAIEHSSVAGPIDVLEKEGFEVVRLRPDNNGMVSEKSLEEAITPSTILVSVMLINNEMGAIQPVESIKSLIHRVGAPALIHIDAVQAFAKYAFSPEALGADLLSVSGHKIHAPKGAGALYVRKGARILPLEAGGGQERNLRPGTQAVPAIAGFGEAAALARKDFPQNRALFQHLRAHLLERLTSLPSIAVNSPEDGAAHILNLSVLGIRSETMLHFLADRNIFVSSGSACSRGAKSYVLAAMNLPDERIDSALRISFSHENTREDIDRFVDAIQEGIKTLTHIK